MGKRAFTLTEVLIVIAIISILTVLLLPVFAHAREKAGQTACAANLKQIGTATYLYAQDHDNLFPYGADPSDVYTAGWARTQWANLIPTLPLVCATLAPYAKNGKVWDCPDDTGYDKSGTFESVPLSAHPTAFGKFGMSYAYQTYLVLLQQTTSGVTAWDFAPPYAQYGPEHVILMQDMDGSWHGGIAFDDKRYNVLFCDGHLHYTTRDEDSDLWLQTFTPPIGQ